MSGRTPRPHHRQPWRAHHVDLDLDHSGSVTTAAAGDLFRQAACLTNNCPYGQLHASVLSSFMGGRITQPDMPSATVP
jgi:hypothetical protein